MPFLRTYVKDGVTYKCTVACNVRGPLIENVEKFDAADINCPSCIVLGLNRGLMVVSD